MALTFKNPTTGNITEGTLEQGQAFADKGFNPVDPTITGDDLKPVQPIDFNEPEPITPFPVADLDTEVPKLELTAPETEAQGLTERLGDLNRQLVGETAFRAGEEETQGLPELQKTQTDLSSQLKAIQSEAKAIPLQLQQEATGRGITAGGLAPLQTARLRTNAIQALGVSALLEASKGNIGLAQQQVDRAVAQKFNPIREEINANINNLNLIIQSPEYSLAQKNRANEQLALQEERKTQLANEEANETEIKNLAITAAQSGADVQTLQAIQNAQTPEEALRIATEAGIFQQEAVDDQFTLTTGAKRFDSQGNLIADNPKEAEALTEKELLDISAKKLDIQQKINDLNNVDLDSKTIAQVDKISKSFDDSPIVKNFNEVQNKKLSIDAIVDNGVGGPADLALVFEFMKALDPTSVVRESEYAAASKAGNIFKGWAAKFNGYLKAEGGLLPDEVKQEFKRLSGDKFDIITSQYNNLKDEKARLIDRKTGDVDGLDYLVDYNFTKKPIEFNSLQEWADSSPPNLEAINQTIIDNNYNEEEALQLIKRIRERSNLSSVGGDTDTATLNKVAVKKEGTEGGQCGRFVNNITKLGVGDSFSSKMAKMDDNITKPEAGMVFTMPYKDTGHCGIILSVDNGVATVKDSNWSLDEKIKTHKIPVYKMAGFARA